MSSVIIEQIRGRIASGKIRSDDIKYPDRLTNEDIAQISTEQVYAWIVNKNWTCKDFRRWLNLVKK